MSIWQHSLSLKHINSFNRDTLMEALSIEFVTFDDNSLTAKMPVNSTVHQPLGLLHGGASVALAESVGSMAANLAVDENHFCLGLEINANHLKAMRSGHVYATAKPIHLGGQTQVWSIEMTNESGEPVCISRLTMMVRAKKGTQ